MIPLKALQRQVGELVEDLRDHAATAEPLAGELRAEYAAAKAAQRTGGTYETWLEDVLDQAAVAWVLGCVFVRFCEDNRLVEGRWIGGPTDHASADRAAAYRQAYLVANPLHNDRHWLREGFAHLQDLRATGAIFDRHNPVWRFDISGEAAETLCQFFRQGAGLWSLEDAKLNTRFLGDLYQDLSAHARSTYALLQTPEFVEEFILDRTFEPSVREFGLPDTSVIDPTCGSGHFLLGAFHRLVGRWKDREPATDIRELTQRALRQVTGVDINAFAVAIARFRLMIAALKVCGLTSLEDAPAFDVRVAAGDSLLDWGGEKSRHQGDLVALAEGRDAFAHYTEDARLLADYLRTGHYTVVLGNPPYITVKDKARNELYRRMYSACSGTYALTVPFAQRLFALAKRGDHDGAGAGWAGQITSNSFMKREFGKKLINDYFAHHIELSEIIDTSGAHIPGHGTPTVILIGKNQLVSSRYSGTIRTVLGVRGEPGQPDDPAKGHVWLAIIEQIDRVGSNSEWLSVTDSERVQLSKHPWSLSGGGAADVMRLLNNNSAAKLGKNMDSAGFMAVTRADDVYLVGSSVARRLQGDTGVVPFVTGTAVRDLSVVSGEQIIFPYGPAGERAIIGERARKLLWRYIPQLTTRQALSGTQEQRGLTWFEYSDFNPMRWSAKLKIAFAVVATHNHFVLDRGGRVFNRHAPVIKLAESASEDDHLRLLGVLNSSTACFWLKQVSQPKAGTSNSSGGGNRWSPEPWYERYEFTGTKLEEFSLPKERPIQRTRQMDVLAQQIVAVTPAGIVADSTPTRGALVGALKEYQSVRARMIGLQEELDWEVYRLYGLLDEDLTVGEPIELSLGERAFEIVLARRMAVGEVETQWFARHGSMPITELPAHWSAEYRTVVEKRIAVIESDRNIGLIERPECKRRWATEGWDKMQAEALRGWLLDRLEAPELWGGAPTALSVAQLADRVRHDDDFRSVLDLWVGHDQHDLLKTIAKLVGDEHVPYLPAQRYKTAGLRKRVQWERTWELQRQEDNDQKVEIAVPPKYTSADFAKPSYWRARGKLDVPKERFVSYPGAGRDGDGTLLLGWAGWDHLNQAQALAAVYLQRKNEEAWTPDRLLPLLAGIAELEPWLHQWYTDPKPGYLGSPADFFTQLVDTELAALNSDRPTLTTLRGLT